MLCGIPEFPLFKERDGPRSANPRPAVSAQNPQPDPLCKGQVAFVLFSNRIAFPNELGSSGDSLGYEIELLVEAIRLWNPEIG